MIIETLKPNLLSIHQIKKWRLKMFLLETEDS